MTAEQNALNAAQAIAEALREQILTGKLPPKTRVTQRQLAARFGHSPMPARDAVKMLMAEGLIVQESSKTIVVAPVNLESFIEIMELRRLLEPHALELSMPRLTAKDLDLARAALALSGTTDEPRRMAENHWRFHRALYAKAGRPRLLALIEQQHTLLARYQMPDWAIFGVLVDWAQDELELMDLVERRNARAAVEWLRRDLDVATWRVVAPSHR